MIERDLQVFLVVADELHFGRAAARAHLSQPGLTQAVARLERRLGARLFERTSRRVALTPAGAALVPRAQRLVEDAELAAERVVAVARGELGTVRLGVVGTALLELLPPIVRATREQHPGLTLAVHEATGAAQVADLRSGRLDLGLLHAPADRPPEGLAAELVREDRLGVVVPTDHRLAHRRRVRLVELRDDPLVLLRREREADTHVRYLEACARAGFVPSATHDVTSLQALLAFVASGLGWGFVAEPVQLTTAREGVVHLALADAVEPLPTVLAWSAAGEPGPSAALVRDVVRAL